MVVPQNTNNAYKQRLVANYSPRNPNMCPSPINNLKNNCNCQTPSPQVNQAPNTPITEIRPLVTTTTKTESFVASIPRSKLCYPYDIAKPYCALHANQKDIDKEYEFCRRHTVSAMLFEFTGICKEDMSYKDILEAILKEAWTKITITAGQKHLIAEEITPYFVYETMQLWDPKALRIQGVPKAGYMIKAELILRFGFGCKDVKSFCDLINDDVGFFAEPCSYIRFEIDATNPSDKFTKKTFQYKELVNMTKTPRYRTEYTKVYEATVEGTECPTYLNLPVSGKMIRLWIQQENSIDSGVKDFNELTIQEMEFVKKDNSGACYDTMITKEVCEDFQIYDDSVKFNTQLWQFGCDSACMPDVSCDVKIMVKGKEGSKIKYWYQVVY